MNWHNPHAASLDNLLTDNFSAVKVCDECRQAVKAAAIPKAGDPNDEAIVRRQGVLLVLLTGLAAWSFLPAAGARAGSQKGRQVQAGNRVIEWSLPPDKPRTRYSRSVLNNFFLQRRLDQVLAPRGASIAGGEIRSWEKSQGGKALPLLFVLSPSAFPLPQISSKHPVPLPANFDASKCATCHSDKTAGKVVHPAMGGGCLTCHRVRTIGDTTRVMLKTGTVATLCFQCHQDKDPANLHGKIHPPAVRDCLKCHDPHSSPNENLLRKPISGATAKENLCLSCHKIGVDVPKGGSRHPALDMGCGTCHNVHKVGDPTQTEFAFHLVKGIPALCLTCHDAQDAALAKAHGNQPFAKANCIQCHDPHQSAAPYLAQKFLHPPYAQMGCNTCHQPAKNGKVVLTTQDVNSLCGTCHQNQVNRIQKAKVQHPGALGDCTVCHSPHGGTSRAFLQPNPVAVCLTCHTDLADQGKKAYPHQPAFEQGCAICHEPHGGENANLLRVSDINSLCLQCHGPNASPQPVKGEDLVAIFDGKVKLPADYFKKVPILPLQDGRGHPTANHPVSGLVNFKGKSPFRMNCLSCHQPHASSKSGLLVKDQEPNMAFCTRCHTQGTLPMQ